MSIKILNRMTLIGTTPDSFTRALWKFYQQSYLVAKQEEYEGNAEFFAYEVFVILAGFFNMQ
jgi:hypothetical protein